MDYRRFTKRELLYLLELIQSCTRSRTEADVTGILSRLKDVSGADNAVCALGDASNGNIVRVVNLNYPLEWAKMYMAGEYYKIDPVIKFNYRFYRTHYWKEAAEMFPDKECSGLMNKAADFGLSYGISSGVNGLGYRGSIISFSARHDCMKEHQKAIIEVITPHIHQALVRVCDNASWNSTALSEREREVLSWMKEGKTNWEISAILNISERTVKFHVQNIERKLNAVNKAHAIAIAMHQGLEV